MSRRYDYPNSAHYGKAKAPKLNNTADKVRVKATPTNEPISAAKNATVTGVFRGNSKEPEYVPSSSSDCACYDSEYSPLTPTNCFFLFSDNFQSGLIALVKNIPLNEFKNAVFAYIEMAKQYKIPVIVSTSAQGSPNGPLEPEYKAALIDALQPMGLVEGVNYFPRTGSINVMDCAAAREAILELKRAGRDKVVVNGIATDVCVAFPCLTLKGLGYDVYAALDASGTTSTLQETAATMLMVQQGIKPTTWFPVASALQGSLLAPLPPTVASEPFEPLLSIVKVHYPEYYALWVSWTPTVVPDPGFVC